MPTWDERLTHGRNQDAGTLCPRPRDAAAMSGRQMRTPPDGWLAWLLVPAGLLLFAGANAHLVYVAVPSQPDCVAHSEGARASGRRLSALPSPAC